MVVGKLTINSMVIFYNKNQHTFTTCPSPIEYGQTIFVINFVILIKFKIVFLIVYELKY